MYLIHCQLGPLLAVNSGHLGKVVPAIPQRSSARVPAANLRLHFLLFITILWSHHLHYGNTLSLNCSSTSLHLHRFFPVFLKDVFKYPRSYFIQENALSKLKTFWKPKILSACFTYCNHCWNQKNTVSNWLGLKYGAKKFYSCIFVTSYYHYMFWMFS